MSNNAFEKNAFPRNHHDEAQLWQGFSTYFSIENLLPTNTNRRIDLRHAAPSTIRQSCMPKMAGFISRNTSTTVSSSSISTLETIRIANSSSSQEWFRRHGYRIQTMEIEPPPMRCVMDDGRTVEGLYNAIRYLGCVKHV